MQDHTDEVLIRLYVEGDDNALVVLTARYFDAIYRYCYRLVQDTAVTEDVVQDTFIKVWKSAKTFREGMVFKPWLYRIAHNTAIDFLRKKKMITFSNIGNQEVIEEIFTDESVNIMEETIAQEEKDTLTKKIESLPEHYKQVLLLRAEEMLTLEEISMTLQKPLNTVKSLYRRALKKLGSDSNS